MLIPFALAAAQHGNWDLAFQTLELGEYFVLQVLYHGDLNDNYNALSTYRRMLCQGYYVLNTFESAPPQLARKFDEFLVAIRRASRSSAEIISSDAVEMLDVAERIYRNGPDDYYAPNMPEWVMYFSDRERTLANIKNMTG